MASPSDGLDLPRPFGPYSLLRRLAVGGMAEVYVARARGFEGFEKLVAIKVIHPRFSEDEHFVQMLVEEAKITSLLTHGNIVQTFDLGCVDGVYYIAMEYVEGVDAYRMVRTARHAGVPIPHDVAAWIVAQVCRGLDYAHRKRDSTGRPLGIVHRDISPQNVLLSFAGEVKIVDFGIAKAALRSGETEVGVIKGKYYYMSPEQAWGDPVDARSDLFSAGVVLHELITGRMLYEDDNIATLLDRVRKADVESPSVRRPDTPPELCDITLRALRRSPDERFASARDMADALERFVYATSPSFTQSRLSELLAHLYPGEGGRPGPLAVPTTQTRPVRAPVAARGIAPPPPQTAPVRILADLDEPDDEETRADVSPFGQHASEHAAPVDATGTQTSTAPVARPDPGFEEEPTLIADSTHAPSGEPSGNRATETGSWEDDATLVGTGVQRSDRAGRASRPGPVAAPVAPFVPSSPTHVATAAGTGPTARTRPGSVPPPKPAVPLGTARLRPPQHGPATVRSQPPAATAGGAVLPDAERASQGAAFDAPVPSRQPPSADSSSSSRAAVAHGAASRTPTADRSTRVQHPHGTADASSRASATGFASPTPAHPPQRHATTDATPWIEPASSSAHARSAPMPSGAVLASATPRSVDPPPSLQQGSVPLTGGFSAVRPPRSRLIAWLLLAAVAIVAVAWAAFRFLGADAGPVLEVLSVPPGATVRLDGVEVAGRTPLVIRHGLEEGRRHRVEVRLEGFEPWTATIRPGHGTYRQIAVLAPMRATMRVETDPPGAHVWVDGVLYGVSPLDVPGLPLGREVEVRAVRAGSGEARARIRIEASDPRPTLRLVLR
ncbi:MAG: protein kinase [Myxococcota bacterium]|nr:protein kinase [Myxococcota bacterium]MDW8360764.1 protein kinase [Myxococcales bacterium]